MIDKTNGVQSKTGKKMDQKEFQKAYGKLVAKAWSDADFKAELLNDPMKVFSENEMQMPDGIEVRMVENTEKITHFILPPEPTDELSDEQLEGAAGGWNSCLLFSEYF